MTISDTKRQELEARGTTGSSLLATTALVAALTLAQYTESHIYENPPSLIRLAGTEGTVAKSHSLEISELDILKQINRIHDNLLKNQVELDYDSKHAPLLKSLEPLFSVSLEDDIFEQSRLSFPPVFIRGEQTRTFLRIIEVS